MNTTVVDPEQARRTLVTTQDLLAEVVTGLNDVNLVALDLETTGLNSRKDSVRLLSLATNTTAYIVDCQSVNPTRIFPILTEATVVAHNALFDLGFLSSLGFEVGKVADTMILSQLLYAGLKVEPLKRGQASHGLDSVVKRELVRTSGRSQREIADDQRISRETLRGWVRCIDIDESRCEGLIPNPVVYCAHA